MYDVKGGTRAVIFDRLSGVKESVVNEGTTFSSTMAAESHRYLTSAPDQEILAPPRGARIYRWSLLH